MFGLGVSRVIEREAEELNFAPGRLHQRNNRRLAANNLVFKLLYAQIVEIRMRITMIVEIEAARDPRLQNFGSRWRSKLLNLLLNHKSGRRNPMPSERIQELSIRRHCGRRVLRTHRRIASGNKREVVDCDRYG